MTTIHARQIQLTKMQFKLHVSTLVGRPQVTSISKTKLHYAKRNHYNKTYALCILSPSLWKQILPEDDLLWSKYEMCG